MTVCIHAYCILLGHVWWIQLGGLFCVFVLNGRRRGVDLGKREVGGGLGEKKLARMQCMREE